MCQRHHRVVLVMNRPLQSCCRGTVAVRSAARLNVAVHWVRGCYRQPDILDLWRRLYGDTMQRSSCIYTV